MARTNSGRIFKRGETWWIDYSHRGERHRESTGSTRRSDAVALLKKRIAEAETYGAPIGTSQERVTLADLLANLATDYRVNGRRSLRNVLKSTRHLTDYFGAARAVDVTTDRITLYIEVRQAEGAASATIQQELAHLKRAFNLAVRARRLVLKPYIPSVRVSNVREGFFEASELERVIAELPADLRPLVRFAALTGWRREEVRPLQWCQVDFPGGVVRLAPGTTKNDEGREFPFHALPPLRALLEEQRERTRALEREQECIIPHVFHRKGRPILDFRDAWDAACERAGLKGWLFHDLRRTAVRNLERAGVPRSVAMKLTGHRTEAVYRRYAIADVRALAEGVEKLARLHAAPAAQALVVPFSAGIA